MCSISSSVVISVLSIREISPFITSIKLCGGIFVAIPTAIPSDPFINKAGTEEGRTEGSFSVSSKFGSQLTVSLSRSFSISLDNFVIRDSVYLIAAALSPSIEPKFPCPSTNSYLIEKCCAILTRASYTELSP